MAATHSLESPMDKQSRRSGFEQLLGSRLRIPNLACSIRFAARRPIAHHTLASTTIAGDPQGDAIEPGRKLGLTTEATELLVHNGKHIVHDVVNVCGRSSEPRNPLRDSL